MAQSLSRILLHLIFSTKNREPLINKNIRPDLHAYIAGVCRKLNSEAYRVGGTEDHVHIACSLPRNLAVSKLLEEIKKSSSAWVKTHHSALSKFSWQAGYGAFSLGQSQLGTLIAYIENQAEHHRTRSFKEELIDFFQKYHVVFDEKYLWD